MPFGTITGSVAGQTFDPRVPGQYVLSTLTFADPTNEYRVTGASVRRDGTRGGSITRLLQKDLTINGQIVRKQALVTLNVSVPNDGTFSSTELDNAIADISLFMTPATTSRFMQGES